jgi:tetratricopeptide (TPR) repeat protein
MENFVKPEVLNVLFIVPLLLFCGPQGTGCQTSPITADHAMSPARVQVVTSESLNSQAVRYVNQGQFEEARKILQHELEFLERTGPATGLEAARTYQLLGEVAQIEGRLAEAEAAFKKSVAIMNRDVGASDFRTANALNSLGWFYHITGRLQEASPLLIKAFAVAQRVLPEDSPELIIFLDSQASLQCHSGHFTNAEKDWLRALRIAEKAFGDDARRYAAILMHLGEMYSGLGDYTAAERLFRRCLAGYERESTQLSVTQAVMMSELAAVYTKLNNFSAAGPLVLRSIEIVNAAVNVNSVPLGNALVLSRAGDYYMVRHDWRTAEKEYRRALKLREDTLGDHPLVASSLRSLSESLRKLNRKNEAKDDLARAKQILAIQNDPAYLGATVDVRAFQAK